MMQEQPVVAILGEPGTFGELAQALGRAGAQVLVTKTSNELLDADGMIIPGHTSSIETYRTVQSFDAERVVGRRVADVQCFLRGQLLACCSRQWTIRLQLVPSKLKVWGSGPGMPVSSLLLVPLPVYNSWCPHKKVPCFIICLERCGTRLKTACCGGSLSKILTI